MRSLLESETSIVGNSISFVDIDETLFRTSAHVKVMKNGKVVRELDNKQFNTDNLNNGESYNFDDFANAETFNKTSEPIEPIVDRVRRAIKSIKTKRPDDKVIILTARRDFDDKELFLKTFRQAGIDVDIDNVYVERTGNLTNIKRVADRKKVTVLKYLRTGKYTAVRMLDDDLTNLREFMRLGHDINNGKYGVLEKTRSRYPNTRLINFYPVMVDENGRCSLLR